MVPPAILPCLKYHSNLVVIPFNPSQKKSGNIGILVPIALGRFPFDQKFRDFRSETEWNGRIPGKVFENLGIRFGRFPFDQIFRFEIPGIPCDEWNSINFSSSSDPV